MSNFDLSRQADLAGIETKLDDPRLTARHKRKMRRTKARIVEQRKNPEIVALRQRYVAAVRANDAEAVQKLGGQLKKIDERLGLDNRKL